MCSNVISKVTDDWLGFDIPEPKVIAPPKQPTKQEASAPDATTAIERAQQNQSAMSGGIANTLYTGNKGVNDDELKLGKKTLLGG